MSKLKLVTYFFVFICGCAHNPSKSDVTTIPFALHDNRILVSVLLNGKGPYTFVFDTGGARAHTLNYNLAKELGLPLERARAQSGAGEMKQDAWITRVNRYSISNLELNEQNFDVIDLSAIQKAFKFERLDGIIGYDVLKKSITCIDFEKQTLTLKNGRADCFGSSGVVIPFRLDHDTPIISGSVNGISTELVIDTGDRSAFSLFQKFAGKNDLDHLFENEKEIVTGVGVGGVIKGRLYKTEKLNLGAFELANVLSRLPSTKAGYFSRSELGGSIGNEILRRFNVILDYSKNEITLIKNSYFEDEYRFVPPSIEGAQ